MTGLQNQAVNAASVAALTHAANGVKAKKSKNPAPPNNGTFSRESGGEPTLKSQ